jgi:hypothetical protein
MDTMYVNNVPFLTTVSRNILYRTATPLVATTEETYRSALKEVIRYYDMGGFKIDTIYCDNESQKEQQYSLKTHLLRESVEIGNFLLVLLVIGQLTRQSWIAPSLPRWEI